MTSHLHRFGLADAYRVPGFIIRRTAHGIFGDSHTMILALVRRGKKRYAACVVQLIAACMTMKDASYGICRAGIEESFCRWKYDESGAILA